MTRENYWVLILFSGLVLITSCKDKDRSSPSTGSVIVINEGAFTKGDASISVYNSSTKMVANDVFQSTNHFVLGDVAQSVTMIGDTAYIVMNNSQKIVVADANNNFLYLYTIEIPGSSPRCFLPIDNTKGYVTELYANKIWIVNYRTASVIGSIPVTGWTEQILHLDNKVFVTQASHPTDRTHNRYLLEIDPTTNQVTNKLALNAEPNSMVTTSQGRLFLLTGSLISAAVSPTLMEVNPSTLAVIKKLKFSSGHSPSTLRFGTYQNQIFYADSGIYRMNLGDSILPIKAFINSNNWNIYGFNIDPTNGDLYISDALDYQQRSKVMRYSRSGDLVDAFVAGLITNGFIFR